MFIAARAAQRGTATQTYPRGSLNGIFWLGRLEALAVPMAKAATAPADPCSPLPAATVSSTLGQTYRAPRSTAAPRPFANPVLGTDSHYAAPIGNGALWLRIYFDPSASEATSLFTKLKMSYSPPTPVEGIGDEAYLDPRHGLHVRKS